MKKSIKLHQPMLILLLAVLIPIAYHIAFSLPAVNDFFVAKITIGDLLNYSGQILGFSVPIIIICIQLNKHHERSKFEKLREIISNYIGILSPYFSIFLINDQTPKEVFNAIRDFSDKEHKSFNLLHLYLSEGQRKTFESKLNNYRGILMTNLAKLSDSLIEYKSETKSVEFSKNQNTSEAVTNFGIAMQELYNYLVSMYQKIQTEYEEAIF